MTDTRAGRDAGTPLGDVRLGFVGDVMLGRGVNDAHVDGDPAAVWGDVRPRLQSLDGVLCNLECCLSTRGERAPDRGYYFRADPTWAVPALQAGNVAWVDLANNHVLDFGRTAFSDTLAALDGAAVPHSGAGADWREAFAPAHLRVGDLDVAVVAATDRAPGYAAGPARTGTAYLPMTTDPAGGSLSRLTLSAAIEDARDRDPDLLVASLHWGPNWVTQPDTRYRRLARWLVDAGADVVHGHSAHVPQGVERYDDGLIIHDAGDFVDDYALVSDLHNDRSVLFELVVEDGRPAGLVLRPVVIEAEAVHLASGEPAAWVRDRMRARSAPFGTGFRRAGESLVVELAPPE